MRLNVLVSQREDVAQTDDIEMRLDGIETDILRVLGDATSRRPRATELIVDLGSSRATVIKLLGQDRGQFLTGYADRCCPAA